MIGTAYDIVVIFALIGLVAAGAAAWAVVYGPARLHAYRRDLAVRRHEHGWVACLRHGALEYRAFDMPGTVLNPTDPSPDPR